jgi:hypothetical protein
MSDTFQQQLDAANRMSWQGQVDAKQHLEAEKGGRLQNTGVVVHRKRDPLIVEDQTVVLVQNIALPHETQAHKQGVLSFR